MRSMVRISQKNDDERVQCYSRTKGEIVWDGFRFDLVTAVKETNITSRPDLLEDGRELAGKIKK